MKRKILFLLFSWTVLFQTPAFAATHKDLELWTLTTLADLMVMFLILGFVLHLARTYYYSTLRSFRVRMSGEHWAMIFLIIRDGALILSFLFGLILINPDIMGDIKLAVPFLPLGTVILGVALLVKMGWDVSSDRRANTVFTGLLFVAVLLDYFGFTFVMEAAPSEWASHVAPFWENLRLMRSNLNPHLAMVTFWVVFPMIVTLFLAMLGVWIFKKVPAAP
ncbi:MAG: hypothetical protein GXO76_15110, partial [Calditrichaeota bacterium]|nr:hypothetical protein [Calditrichota bacterium]